VEIYPQHKREGTELRRCSLLLIGLLPLIAAEAPAMPRMEVHFGHQGLHRYRSWSPLKVRLESGRKPLEGRIEVAAPSGNVYLNDAHIVRYSRPVSLPPHADETFDFAVFVDEISRPLKITFRGRDGEMLSRTFDLRENLITGDIIIALSREPVFDFLAHQLGVQGRVVHPRPERLPERQEAYDGVRAIIIHDADLSALKRKQLRAIKGWAAVGGRLIVTGGPGPKRLSILEKELLLPGKVMGIKPIDALSAMGRRYGGPIRLPAPLPVITMGNVAGRVLLSEGDRPLIIKRRWGKGEVLFLTFDPVLPVFLRWRGFDALWTDLVSGPGPPDFGLFRPWKSGVGHRALKNSVIPFPPLWQAALFVTAYFVVYLIIRRYFGGRKTLWLAVSIMVAVFVLSADLIFYRPYLPAGYLKLQFAVIDIYPEAGMAHRRTEVSLFSSRGRRTQAKYFYADSAVSGWAPRSYRGRERDYELAYEGPSGFTIRAPLKPWAHRSFNMLETIEPPVKMKVFHEGGGFYISLYNSTSNVVSNGLVVANGKMMKLNIIPPGKSLSLKINPDDPQGGWTPLNLWESAGEPYPGLKTAMLEDSLLEIRHEEGVSFLGWLEEGPFGGLTPGTEHRPVSLTLIRANLDVPRGFAYGR
jgi:hypothetical protein